MYSKVWCCLTTALAITAWMPTNVLGAAVNFSTIQSRGAPTPGQAVTGDATFFSPGLGACGQTNTASDSIVALSKDFFSTSLCGKQVVVTNAGKSVTTTVADLCAGCANSDIDLSPGAFDQIANEAQGRVAVQWTLQ